MQQWPLPKIIHEGEGEGKGEVEGEGDEGLVWSSSLILGEEEQTNNCS